VVGVAESWVVEVLPQLALAEVVVEAEAEALVESAPTLVTAGQLAEQQD